MSTRIALSVAALPLLVVGCATAPPASTRIASASAAPAPQVQEVPADSLTESLTTQEPFPSARSTPPATESTPTADLTLGYRRPVYPDRPLPTLTTAQHDVYGTCLTTTLGSWSKGDCANLVREKLAGLGYYQGPATGRISASAVNAVLRYQRSRDLPATGTVSEQTWYALASEQPARTEDLPPECTLPGVVLCVDQAHDTLRWLRDGEVIRTIKVRTGGFTTEPKTGQWRVHPTVNGFYRVYNKHRNPKSENYGAGAMPYSVMFDPNMYFHYSSDFARRGYSTSSHGCVNIGSKDDAVWVFENTPIDARVLVY